MTSTTSRSLSVLAANNLKKQVQLSVLFVAGLIIKLQDPRKVNPCFKCFKLLETNLKIYAEQLLLLNQIYLAGMCLCGVLTV